MANGEHVIMDMKEMDLIALIRKNINQSTMIHKFLRDCGKTKLNSRSCNHLHQRWFTNSCDIVDKLNWIQALICKHYKLFYRHLSERYNVMELLKINMTKVFDLVLQTHHHHHHYQHHPFSSYSFIAWIVCKYTIGSIRVKRILMSPGCRLVIWHYYRVRRSYYHCYTHQYLDSITK